MSADHNLSASFSSTGEAYALKMVVVFWWKSILDVRKIAKFANY